MLVQSAVVVTAHRQRMAAYMATQLALVAFGDGGSDASGNPIAPLPIASGLQSEKLRKSLFSIQNTGTSLVVTGAMESADLVGVNVSEASILDIAGRVVAIKTFKPINKLVNTRYEIKFTLNF
mgnify:CR=1 FL=1